MKHNILSRPLCHILVIVSVGVLIYANSIEVPFVLDDYTSIVRNTDIHDIGHYFPGGKGFDSNPRRWVGYFTFALNYQFGSLNVAGYHLVNLIIHLMNAILVYALVRLSFRTPYLRESSLIDRATLIAFLAALFFVAHPIQTQAVTYIVQRLTSLATMFFLLAIVLYIQGRLFADQQEAEVAQPRTKQAARHSGTATSRVRVVIWMGAAVLAAILAMQTKEIAFTLPLAVLLYEVFFFSGAWRRRIIFLFPVLLTLPIIPLAVILGGGVDEAGDTSIDGQLRAGTQMPRLDYLLTQFRVLVTYLRLLILPINQNLDYDYPIYSELLSPQVVLSLLLLAALIWVAFVLAGCRRPASLCSRFGETDPALRLISFGILWFFLTLVVESSIIPIEDVIFEHRLYLPMLGPALIFSIVTVLAAKHTHRLYRGALPLLMAGLILLILSNATWQRNQVWGSQLLLWEDTVRQSPLKVRPWYNLATYYAEEDRLQEAVNAFAGTLKLNPDHYNAWHNLGRVYLTAGMLEDAIAAFERALQINPELINAKINLAVALIRSEQFQKAVGILSPMVPAFPELFDLRLNLGIAYAHSGDFEAAEGELRFLATRSPDFADRLVQQILAARGSTNLE